MSCSSAGLDCERFATWSMSASSTCVRRRRWVRRSRRCVELARTRSDSNVARAVSSGPSNVADHVGGRHYQPIRAPTSGESDLVEADGTIWREPDGALQISVGRVDGVKCAQRCWRYVQTVSTRGQRRRTLRTMCRCPTGDRRCRLVSDNDAVGTDSVPEAVQSPRSGLPSDRTRLILGALAGLIVVLDQATKAIVRATLPLHDSVELVPGFLSLHSRAQHWRCVRAPEWDRLSHSRRQS